MITRTYTDVKTDDVDLVLLEITLSGGTAERLPQPDHTETIIARYADLDPVPVETSEFPWMPIAVGELGIHEGANADRISEYFRSTELGDQPDSVPWCSAFVNFCMQKSGQPRTRSARARSWLDWGEEADDFVPGCVVVLPRGNDPSAGHVGFFAGFDEAGNIRLLGGNQKDSVSVTSFRNMADKVLGKRALPNVAAPPQPAPAVAGAGDVKTLLIEAMDAHHIIDDELRAGIAAIAGGESGMALRSEIGWSNTVRRPDGLTRARRLFSALSGMSDDEIRALAADDEQFFNTVYAGKIGNGDFESGDGFRYRGRGIFQLTGRDNYKRYGGMLQPPVDLLGDPELANDPKIAVEIAVVYMLDRYGRRGGQGGFKAMKAAVGNSIGPPDANKDQLFAEYRASGEFNVA
jgi:uncharacterized protein (TIGR02594 family)